MRIALISDLHANAVALKAVLRDVEVVGVDQLICLGDVATLGPHPEDILETLQRLECPCILGNHDEFLFHSELIHTYTEAPVVVDSVDWCRAQLSKSHLDFLRAFQTGMQLELDSNVTLQLFHGSPRSHMENLLATTPPEELDRLLDGASATVMAGGHTHLQMMRQHRGILLVNPGSVGMPFREFVTRRAPTVLDHAEYAVVEASNGTVGVSLRRVALDKSALRHAVASRDFPLRQMLLDEYGTE